MPINRCEMEYCLYDALIELLDNLDKLKMASLSADAFSVKTHCKLFGRQLVNHHFGQWILGRQDQIHARDDSMFSIKNNGPLAGILNNIGDAWNVISPADRDVIWDFMDEFVNLAQPMEDESRQTSCLRLRLPSQ
jgi:hypothetical protein